MHHWFSHPAAFMLLGEITRVARQSATSAPNAVIASMLAVLCATFVTFRPAHADAVVYRVNVGGPAIAPLDAGPAWGADTEASPSAYVNYPASGNWFGGTDQPMGAPHASVPAWVPAAVFDDERWDLDSGPEMQWEFPVANGSYRVNLFFAEGCNCAQFANGRKFDVAIENDLVLDDFDVFATYGGFRPGMQTFLATVTDGRLSIEFRHGPANAPSIRGIEIQQVDVSQTLQPSRNSVGFGSTIVDSTSAPQSISLQHLGSGSDPPITITGVSVSGPFAHTLTSQTLLPGQTRSFNVTFHPTALGPASGTLVIHHSGSNSPIEIALSGTGSNLPPVGFGKSFLQNVVPSNPTSLQFGPDGRLYVSEMSGVIVAYDIERDSPNLYRGFVAHVVDALKNIPNHDDDGSLNPAQNTRLVTGILVTGTAANPVIYACSSDPRINVPGLPGLDTNSGILSRLTWNGSSWVKQDLVRGLPRSKNDHASNGLQLDAATNTLYIAQGGNTNMGAPSNNFSLLPEYALSGAILSIDLDGIGNTTYDLPTLDDEDRPGVNDAADPFGGNFGRNQAVLVPGGPVQIHSPGYRNPFDLLITTNGRMYTIDNGPNSGWGGPPSGEGPGGACTNLPNESGAVSLNDNLHRIAGAGFYAGHPNPTRASVTNTFNASNPQSPVPAGHPGECDYLEPGTDGSLATWPFSTNGLCEYRASNLGGALKGNLLAASFGNEVERVVLNAAGDSATSVTALFTNVGNMPLDVTAQGDEGPFPGTIWVCNFGSGLISVYEPSDYDGNTTTCTGVDDAGLDEDADGYSNADEIDNGTSPCSAGDAPSDFDGDFVSDLNDPDDDNDGLLDVVDPFAIDGSNGAAAMPILYTWDAGNPGFGLLGLGFTGLMADSVTDYRDRFDPVEMTAGGAAGKVTIDHVPAGDALGARNDQRYAFQFGVAGNAGTPPFVVRTRLSSPFFDGGAPSGAQSDGLFIGAGADDDYLKIVATGSGGQPAIEVVHEILGTSVSNLVPVPGLLAGAGVDLQLVVDPAAATVQPRYGITGGSLVNAGPAIALTPGTRLHDAVTGAPALAVGIIATSRGASPFAATWEFIEVAPISSVGVAEGPAAGSLRLLPVRPNPTSGAVVFGLELPRGSRVRLQLYDLHGARVRNVADHDFRPGVHSIRWDGRDERGARVANGVYFARIEVGGEAFTQRVVVLK